MDNQTIYAQANDKGNAAVQMTTVTPMVVQQRENPLNDDSRLVREYFVADGVCGFASVTVKPANSKFAKYLVANGLGRKAYNGGVCMSIRQFNQSLTKKEAYAYAFASVLNEHGIKAYVESRID
jgi:hypothetical protein